MNIQKLVSSVANKWLQSDSQESDFVFEVERFPEGCILEMHKLFEDFFTNHPKKRQTFVRVKHGLDSITDQCLVSFTLKATPFSIEKKEERTCHFCLKNQSIATCDACKYTRYCSKKCQREHWKDHKRVCKEFAQLFEQNALMKY